MILDSIAWVLRAEHKQREGKGKWTKTRVWHLFFAGETRQLHIVWLMYLSVQPDLEHRVREGNEEIWWLALLLSQTNVGSSAHCSTLTPMHACTRATTHTCIHTHRHKEKRCNWLSMIRLFLDPQTLPLIKILICRTILEAVDWYIMCNICLPPVSCSETQTDTWYLWISPFLTVTMTTCDQQSLNLTSSSAGQNL